MWELIKKTNKNISLSLVLISLYDILFYVFAMLGMAWFYSRLLKMGKLLMSPELAALASAPNEINVKASYQLISTFYMQLIGSTLIVIVFLLIIWSLSRYSIWQNITGKKWDVKSVLKFIPANALWFVLMLIPVVILFLPFYNYIKVYGSIPLSHELNMLRILFIPLLIIVFYLTNVMHLVYFRTGKVFMSILHAFKIGTLKAYPLLVMYIVSMIIVSLISMPFGRLGAEGGILFIIFMIIALGWVKIFFRTAIKSSE